MKLTKHQVSLLNMFSENTYGIALSWKDAEPLEKLGLIQWVPPKFGATQYNITENGKEERDKYNDSLINTSDISEETEEDFKKMKIHTK